MKDPKDPNKSKSFLYNLYQRYKQKQEHLDVDTSQNGADLIAETIQGIQEVTIPTEKKHLQPLHDLYSYYLKEGILQGDALDLLSFEARLSAPLKELPDDAERDAEIASFEELLCTEATKLLRDFALEQALPPLLELEPMEDIATEGAKSETAAADAVALPLESNLQPEPDAQPEPDVSAEADLALNLQDLQDLQSELNLDNEPKPCDALCRVYITSDKIQAYLFVIPPRNGGAPLDKELLLDCLVKEGIQYGVDEACLDQMAETQAYLQIFHVAQGYFPVDGKDGLLIPQIDCSTEIEIQQNEQGVSDFKNINSIRTAVKDQVICAIILPEPGIPGKTVKGEELPARDGKPAPDNSGKNTVISEDKTRLLAVIDGQITLKNGRYHIESILMIDGNVDYGVGNIQFEGDVVIRGDVCNGFTVKASGSVTVQGMVESADIIAGGDVIIFKGMNGNYSGLIDAKGMVKTSFLENCTVYVEGALHASSIIASKIFCGDTVYVLDKHGAIIGGSITAFKSVEAKVIGSQSRRETEIILGEMPRMSEKKAQAETELETVQDMLEKMNKNLNYLSGIQKKLPPDKLEIFQQLRMQYTIYQGRREELMEFLDSIALAEHDFSECRLKCGMIFPPVKITIGSDFLLLKEAASRCMIFRGASGIVVGNS